MIEQILEHENLKTNLFRQDVDLGVLAADCLEKGHVNLAKVFMKGIFTVKKASIHQLLYPAIELDNIQLLLEIMEHFGPNDAKAIDYHFQTKPYEKLTEVRYEVNSGNTSLFTTSAMIPRPV